jgi:DNA-binding GntR family transcriptional regulator
MGLVSRRRGAGTRVQAKNARSRFVASLSSLSDLLHYTQRTRLALLAERSVIARDEVAALLRCKSGERWLKFETCRYPIGSATPISYTEIYVQLAYEGIRARIEGAGVWVYGLIEEYYGERIVEVQQEVGAIATPPRIAKLLRAPAQAPALHVLRYYYGSGGRLLSMSMNIYPENRFKFSTRWRLQWEGRA